MIDSDDPDPVSVPIGDSIDLHAFAPPDVVEVVREYLECARAAGFREVRLIHGRGRGFQRASLRSLLASLPYVVEAFDAPPGRGGWGATVVLLAPPQEG